MPLNKVFFEILYLHKAYIIPTLNLHVFVRNDKKQRTSVSLQLPENTLETAERLHGRFRSIASQIVVSHHTGKFSREFFTDKPSNNCSIVRSHINSLENFSTI